MNISTGDSLTKVHFIGLTFNEYQRATCMAHALVEYKPASQFGGDFPTAFHLIGLMRMIMLLLRLAQLVELKPAVHPVMIIRQRFM